MTITDIARMAGVSSAAVSRYFNNGYLSEDKKEAIRSVVEATGYRPSLQAQVLRTKKTKTIGVIIPKIDSSSMSRVVSGILSVLDEQEYRMLLADTRNSPKRELEYMATLEESKVDGIIIAGTVFSAAYRKAIRQSICPVVIVGQELTGFNCVFHDDYHAMYDITLNFLQRGKKQLGYIGVTEKDRAVGDQRYRGYCDALQDKGDPECQKHYAIGDFTMASGEECMCQLYTKYPELEAVVCATDRIAIGARNWLKANHPDLVDKIALSGQGDSDMVRVCTPPISTIRYHYEESGAASARRLLELIQMENTQTEPVSSLKLGYSLVDRMPCDNR